MRNHSIRNKRPTKRDRTASLHPDSSRERRLPAREEWAIRAGVVWLILALASTFPAKAQDSGAETTAKPSEEPPAKVEVTETTADDAIADRLRSILEATGRYNDPRVRVEDGVVFLRGEAEKDDARAWATRLAERTEGVVAVTNQMRTAPQPTWSLEPARNELLSLWRDVITRAPLIGVGLVLLFGVSMIARVSSHWLARWLVSDRSNAIVENVVSKVVFFTVLVAGVYLFLRVSGLTRLAVTVVGGTGVAGIVLGFAFRDIAENFLASILISLQKPFHIGDVIEVEGYLGVVRKVTIRGTLLMDFDGNHIQIANAAVYKSTVKNYTANPKTRISFVIGVGYDADVEEAQRLALKSLTSHEAVLDDPAPQILVDELAASTVNLKVYLWIDGSRHSMLKMKSVAMRLVVNAFDNAGISLPDEAREVIFPEGVPVSIERDGDSGAPPHRELVPATRSKSTPISTEAEGGLETEALDIEKQARDSRDPEGGADILGDTDSH